MSSSHQPFHSNFARPDAGSHTVEGNVSGARAAQLAKQRQAQQEEFELAKASKDKSLANATLDIGSKFQPARIGNRQEKDRLAVGLVTAEDFKRLAEAERDQSKKGDGEGEDESPTPEALAAKAKAEKKARKKRKRERKKVTALLSFGNEEEDEEENVDGKDDTDKPAEKTKVSKKDPTVDTSFLPDQQRDADAKATKKRLEREWKERQDAQQNQQLEIVYSYWDGSGHRRTCTVRQGDTVGDFIEKVRQDLCRGGEFRELQQVGADALLYVKEDLILPHDITFYDLIATKARGKSGPLFQFDVHDDVRLGPLDVRIEKDESHPGKIVERRWYERNKHIFPASRWEVYDPSKDYGRYTIHGAEVNGKKAKV